MLIVDDDAQIPVHGAHAVPHLADVIGRFAGGHRPVGQIAGMRDTCPLSFTGQPAGEPVLLPGDVVEDVPESQAFEPPRGSRAQVSLGVVAVDDDGTISVELPERRTVQILQGIIARSGQMLLLVLLRGQHFDQLRSIRHEPPDLRPSNPGWPADLPPAAWCTILTTTSV